MARRRYLSTDVSVDSKVNKLSDFAALLYTWALPHFGDDCRLTARNAEEIQFTVMPGRRHVDLAIISDAVNEIFDAHLWGIDDQGRVFVPSKTFYKYQTYIQQAKRVETPEISTPARFPGDQRSTPQNAEDRRETPQMAASPSPSPSPSQDNKNYLVYPASPGESGPAKRKTPRRQVPLDWEPGQSIKPWAFKEKFTAEELAEELVKFREHHGAKGTLFANLDLAFMTWMRNSKRFAPRSPPGAPARVAKLTDAQRRIMNSGVGHEPTDIQQGANATGNGVSSRIGFDDRREDRALLGKADGDTG